MGNFSLFLLATLVSQAATVSEYELLKRFPPLLLQGIGAGGRPDGEGLVGANRGHWYEAGMQRGGMWTLIAAADDAWRAVGATFARQLDDGGFASNPTPDATRPPDLAGRAQTAFFFLQELAHALLVLRESPLAPHFTGRIAALEPKLRRAAAFASADFDTLIRNNRKAANRILIAAKAFAFCGVLLDDEPLRTAARRLIGVALEQRDPATGAFLENGGLDSSYNAVSLLFAEVILLHFPHAELAAALPAAMKWQGTRIQSTGEVSAEGNSRTGVSKETYLGHPKNVNYSEVALALAFLGLAYDEPETFALADRVFAFGHRPRR